MSSEDKVGLTMPLDDVKSFNSGHKVEAQPEPYKLDDPSAALQRGLSSRHISIMTVGSSTEFDHQPYSP